MGQPILAADYENLSEEQLTTLLDLRIRDCVGTAQRQLGREPNP